MNGLISTARAVGDFDDANGNPMDGMSAKPKISCFPLKEIQKGVLVLTCDGPFEVDFTTNKFGAYLWEEMKSEPDMSSLALKSVQASLDAGSLDNLTIMAISIN